jgi:hypothetical protein
VVKNEIPRQGDTEFTEQSPPTVTGRTHGIAPPLTLHLHPVEQEGCGSARLEEILKIID